MIIEGRKPKPYSEKLFNQLCLLYLLIDNDNSCDAYIVKTLFGASPRTVRRYTAELHECGLTPPISYKWAPSVRPPKKRRSRSKKRRRIVEERKPKSELDYIYTCPVWERGDWEVHYEFEDYAAANLNEERRQDRLFRCGYMLMMSMGSLQEAGEVDPEDIPPSDFVTIDGEEYVFDGFSRCDKLYQDLSPRTQQRDIKVVKDVLIRMRRFSA